VLATPFFYAVY